ncbi:OmpA family protein [Capnocytophaga sp. oral taxon 878]|uniref:OmpA family protein n=1 Tax=Capnocytophaga sp. oral taxon 878 TaxID=1316596 RepID=UPI000D03C3DD|nr:OmpA family protein [Capnocytophaga sp. oral taxon 878]AVM50175.1 flagellar motor protein MotB [Capnocytophaga sp. oral taxon 878]
MKKSILVLASLFITGAYAQDYNKWSIDVNGGVNKPITPLSAGYSTSTPNLWGANVGVRYMLNNKFGIRLGGGYDSFKEKKDTNKFDSRYWNVNLQGYANLGRVLSFEDWTSDITLLVHAGGGYAQLRSDYLGSNADQMLFATAGVTPEIRLSNRISLLLDASLYVNARQNRTYDTYGVATRRGFQGAHFTTTIGLNIALGKQSQHADWAVTSSKKDDEEVAKRVAALENNVADLKDKVGNKQDKMNDANGNGIPDEIENYLNNNYQAKNGSTANNGGDSGVIADLIKKGYVSTYFDFNSSKPQTASTWAIDIIVKYMKENSGSQVTISGYADELGGTNYNTTLSQKRANAVKDILVKAGIDASRISVEGKGEDTSVDKNSAGARQIARRATFNLK